MCESARIQHTQTHCRSCRFLAGRLSGFSTWSVRGNKCQPSQDNGHSVHPAMTSHTLAARTQKTLTPPRDTSTICTVHWPLWHCPCILLLSARSLSLPLSLFSLHFSLNFHFFVLFYLPSFLSSWTWNYLTHQYKDVKTIKKRNLPRKSNPKKWIIVYYRRCCFMNTEIQYKLKPHQKKLSWA